MNESLKLIAGLIGVIAYIFLIVEILKNKIEQSFAAFFLWGLLDGIAMITTIIQGGNFWLPLSNAAGSTCIAILLVIKKQVSWSWVETMTASLVVICLVIWNQAGGHVGVIASSIAVVIASIPQMADTYKDPASTPRGTYFIFLAANVLSFIAGTAWSVEERFYPACSIFLTVVILGFSFRKTLAS